ncbi:LysR family transcriptional regulator, partial [Acinetobacter baumannii]|uniref:LysR family transcriptional regulator n=1 Tax=Acinetobacter baumannii TaxID=470 RepID=UPI002FE1F425
MLKHSNLEFKWVEQTLISSFDDFYYFYLVVKHGGFSAASEAENISKSKLSRRIIDLENKFRGCSRLAEVLLYENEDKS